MESILTSIKKLLGIAEEYAHFDADIIMHINSAFMTLSQLGIGPKEGFSIKSDAETWSDFTGDSTSIEAVKTYVFIKVKMVFDPPTSSFVMTAYEHQAQELEWRLNVQAENKA